MSNGQDTEGLWVTVSDLARLRCTNKSVVSRRIAAFETAGRIEVRLGPNRSKLVQIAAYDRLTMTDVDAIRSAAHRPDPFPVSSGVKSNPDDPVLAREQARRVAYQADLAKLDLDERLGLLLPVSEASAAFTIFAEKILSVLETLPTKADELAAAVAKDGVHGARGFLKLAVLDLRKGVVAAVRAVAAAQPSLGLSNRQERDAVEARPTSK